MTTSLWAWIHSKGAFMKTACAIETAAWMAAENKPVSEECNPNEGLQFFTGLVTGVLLSVPFWVAVAWIFLR
jgi:hypothetical protein